MLAEAGLLRLHQAQHVQVHRTLDPSRTCHGSPYPSESQPTGAAPGCLLDQDEGQNIAISYPSTHPCPAPTKHAGPVVLRHARQLTSRSPGDLPQDASRRRRRDPDREAGDGIPTSEVRYRPKKTRSPEKPFSSNFSREASPMGTGSSCRGQARVLTPFLLDMLIT